MSRWLPHPVVSLVLFAEWLLLSMSVEPAHLLLAAALAVGVPLLLRPFAPVPVRVRAPATAVRLAVRVLGDIVASNVQVAIGILGPEKALRLRFVWVPLELRHPAGVAALAGIVTMTPGTVSADLSPDGAHLLVHALDVPDEAALVAQIKSRYEAPLKEIFG
jgi:multicomponent K+:H+ antiporter subunit E